MRRVPYVAVIAMTAAVAAARCGSSTPAGTTAAASSAGPTTVDVVSVVASTLNVIIPLPGELQPYERVDVFSKVSGFVKSIAVDRGAHVRQGDVLVRLEAPELLAQRAEAQAKVQGAEAELAAAQARLASDDATYQHLKAASSTAGVVSGNTLEVSQKAVDADRAQVESQQQLIAAAKEALQSLTEVAGYLDVKAPFDGVVTERNVHDGALVGPGGAPGSATPMLRVESISRLRLVVPVPESYIAAVREGRVVQFTVPAYPGRLFSAPIARVSHTVDVKTRTMPIELEVANTTGELAAGTFADVRWPVERKDPTLFVPTTCVASTLDRMFVVRIRDGKAEWVDVRTGVSTGKLIEVFGDLRAGDQVAVRGTDEIKAGTAITARTPAVPK